MCMFAEARNSTERVGIGLTRVNKNAPAEMPSNRPVRRLRVDANNTAKKTVDPRWAFSFSLLSVSSTFFTFIPIYCAVVYFVL